MAAQNLKSRVWALFIALNSQLLGLNFVFASFEDNGTGARAAALGGAFTPLADDVHALYYNPAGLVYLKRKELSATYGLTHTGISDKSKINDTYAAYGHPLKPEIGTLGLSWQQLSVESLYDERTINLGYARRLSQRWSAGMNLKQLYRQFSAPVGQSSNVGIVDTSKSDPVFAQGNSRSNIGLDFGFLFRPYRNYSYGLMFQNLNEPNLAISESDRDSVPMAIRTGVAYNERALTLLGELDMKKSSSGQKRDIFFTAAAEKWFLGSGFAQADLALRGSLAYGSRSYAQFTFGLAYRLDAVQVDYGFMMPLGGLTIGNSHGTHRISFTLRFGRTIAEPDYEVRMRGAEIAAKKAEEELERLKQESEKLAEELLKLKTESEKRKVELEQTQRRVGKEAAVKESAARYAEAMDRYWRRKSQQATMEERIGILSQTLKEFAGSGLDLSLAEKELAIAKSDRAKSEVDLAVAWSYYQKIVMRGASVPERIELLSRVVERFGRTGVDMSNVREELKSLRGR